MKITRILMSVPYAALAAMLAIMGLRNWNLAVLDYWVVQSWAIDIIFSACDARWPYQ